jgi:hypothetical protein
MATPDIEFLWWEGCPSTDRALADLREALTDVGLTGVEIRTREVRTDEEAVEPRFRGSPTILIDGIDVAGQQPEEGADGLSCRVYRRRDGRISPVPDPDDVREALRRAVAYSEVNR